MADTQADDRAPSLAHAVAPPERLKPKAAFPLAVLCVVCGCGFGAQVYELRVAGRRRKERENTVFLVCVCGGGRGGGGTEAGTRAGGAGVSLASLLGCFSSGM